jgi:hypothetical protein
MNKASILACTPATPEGTRLRLGTMRIATGLIHALSLLWIYRTWSSHLPYAAGPLMLVLLFALPVAASSLGHMKPAATATWAALCAVVIAALAVHDVWRQYPSLAAAAALAKHSVQARPHRPRQ